MAADDLEIPRARPSPAIILIQTINHSSHKVNSSGPKTKIFMENYQFSINILVSGPEELTLWLEYFMTDFRHTLFSCIPTSSAFIFTGTHCADAEELYTMIVFCYCSFTENCQVYHHWWHCKSSWRPLEVPPGTTKWLSWQLLVLVLLFNFDIFFSLWMSDGIVDLGQYWFR